MIKNENMMISKVKPISINKKLDKGWFARHPIQENHLSNYDCFHQFDQTCGVHDTTCVVDSNESVLSSYQHNISEMCLCIQQYFLGWLQSVDPLLSTYIS